MNQDNQSPIDPMNDPERTDSPERLSAIERKLRKSRPRPVEFDGFALERMALAESLRAVPGIAEGQQRYRPAALVAGSWACGVLVGALTMFLVMTQRGAQSDSAPTAAHPVRDHGRDLPENNLPAAETPESRPSEPAPGIKTWRSMDAAVFALSAPYETAVSGRRGPSLRAGMSLPHLANNSTEMLASIDESATDARDIKNRPKGVPELESNSPLSPGITREHLLRELLHDSPGFVL